MDQSTATERPATTARTNAPDMSAVSHRLTISDALASAASPDPRICRGLALATAKLPLVAAHSPGDGFTEAIEELRLGVAYGVPQGDNNFDELDLKPFVLSADLGGFPSELLAQNRRCVDAVELSQYDFPGPLLGTDARNICSCRKSGIVVFVEAQKSLSHACHV